jgi:hypothetical protein
MSDSDTTTAEDTGTDDGTPTNTELAGRMDSLESKLDVLIGRFTGAEQDAHGAAERHTEDRLDRPSTIADEIRAQLERRVAKTAADAESRASADRLADLERRVTGMAEQTPEAPIRAVSRFMGWH